MNCKKTEGMVVSKRESPACMLKIGDNTIKQVQKFNYLGSLLTENGKGGEKSTRELQWLKLLFRSYRKL